MEPLHKQGERFREQPERLKEYNELVLEELAAIEPIHIASVVSGNYVFDFLILYESLLNSWTFYPFCLHAYTAERETYERLSTLGLDNVEVHQLSEGPRDGGWAGSALSKINLVETSELDRCIVSDVDNVFLAETPELFMLLNQFDLVFVGAPHRGQIIQTSLWAFRRTKRTMEFSRRWYEHSRPQFLADAGGLPFALLYDRGDLEIKVLARPKPDTNERWFLSPYDVQANIRPFVLHKDPLGFREAQMGRAKVLHLGGLRPTQNQTLSQRISTLVAHFPETACAFPLYVRLANRAAARLGMETLSEPMKYVRECSYRAGVLGGRNELPAFLNHRGLVGRGAEVGVAGGFFSEQILRQWQGQLLISIDPWAEAPANEYVDVSNVPQEQQEALYDEAKRRLEAFGDRSSIWRMTSEEAARRIDPNSLDFVYLDARHDYESVKRDLQLWYERVRRGGLLAGHDYLDGTRPQGEFGVKSAVDEFFAAKGQKVNTTHVDAPFFSWFVEIP
jgi:methyltransferase family protein